MSEANDGSRLEVLYLAGGAFKETRLLESPGSVRVRQDMQIAGVVQFRRSFTLANGVETNITTDIHYVHKDALGSVDAVTGQNGNLVTSNAYSPFGMRRDADWSDMSMLPSLSLPEMFDRAMDNGFTQHEMLDDTGLIHMGGRLYDPVLGRFMSADPFVQAPENSQSFNRYSYVWNNPFKYVDPTGYVTQPSNYQGMMGLTDIQMGGFAIPNAWNEIANNIITNHLNNSGVSNGQFLASITGGSSNTGTVAARPASATPSVPPSPPPPSLSVETGTMTSAVGASGGGNGTAAPMVSLGEGGGLSSAGFFDTPYVFASNDGGAASGLRGYYSATGDHQDKTWRLAFDEDGNQITRRAIYSEEWMGAPNPQLIEVFRKRAIPIDLEVKLRTTGEEVLLEEYERNVRSIYRFNLDVPYSYTGGPIDIGPWEKTGKTEWIKTGGLLQVRPVDLRVCVISCGGKP